MSVHSSAAHYSALSRSVTRKTLILHFCPPLQLSLHITLPYFLQLLGEAFSCSQSLNYCSSMTLPTFRSLAGLRQARKQQTESHASNDDDDDDDDDDNSNAISTPTGYTPGPNLKLATSNRRHAIITACAFFFISVIFLILVRPLPSQTSDLNQESRLTSVIDINREHQRQACHP
jgi:hypothetical protein